MAWTPRDTPDAVAYPDFRDGTEACATVTNRDLFHTRQTERIAKAICRRCPLEGACLEWALATDQRFGVWGATTPASRRKLLENRGQL